MEIESTQEDYELSKVIFRDMLEMFRSKHKGDTTIDECTLRNFAGFYSWCVVTKRIPLKIEIPYREVTRILESGLDLYFGSDDDSKQSSYTDFEHSGFNYSFPYTPSSELGELKLQKELTPYIYCSDVNSSKIFQIMEDYKKEYGIK
jgi:hypothetical protein